MVLRDADVRRRRGVVDAVNEQVILGQVRARDLANGGGDRSREHECLPFWRLRQLRYNSIEVVPEAHVQQSIGLVKDELQIKFRRANKGHVGYAPSAPWPSSQQRMARSQ